MSANPVLVRPDELKEMLDHGEVQFVFDLRPKDEFDGWCIEGRTPVEILNIPLEDFEGAEEKHLSRLPQDKEIITVCSRGDSSILFAERLREMGFHARGLDGGMDRWSEFYETRKINSNPDIYQIYRVAKGCITHVIISGNKAVVIDPVRHIEHIEKILADTGAKLVHVFDTHLQADHISGGPMLALKHNALYHISSSDAMDAHFPYVSLRNGEEFRLGFSSLVAAFPTPGHTVGSTSLILDGKFIFTGNTIMPSAVGRPDLRGTAVIWADLLYSTLHERFDHLPDEMVILPSHASGTHEQGKDGIVRLTLGEARRRLPLMSILDRKQFIDCVEATLPENPKRYQDIRRVNLGLLDPDEDRRRELERGKNLCGIPESEMEAGKNLCGIPESMKAHPVTANIPAMASRTSEADINEQLQESSDEASVVKPFEASGSNEFPTSGAETADETSGDFVNNLSGGDEVRKAYTSEESGVADLSAKLALEVVKTVEKAIVAEAARSVNAVERDETMVAVETAMAEPKSEQIIPEVSPQPESEPVDTPEETVVVVEMTTPESESEQPIPYAAPQPAPESAAMPAREEMSEMLGKLAAERFDRMADSIDLKALLLETMTPTLREAMTRVLWETAPEITERLLKNVVQNSFSTLNEKLGSVIRGTVPELAETIIRRELKKLRARG